MHSQNQGNVHTVYMAKLKAKHSVCRSIPDTPSSMFRADSVSSCAVKDKCTKSLISKQLTS